MLFALLKCFASRSVKIKYGRNTFGRQLAHCYNRTQQNPFNDKSITIQRYKCVSTCRTLAAFDVISYIIISAIQSYVHILFFESGKLNKCRQLALFIRRKKEKSKQNNNCLPLFAARSSLHLYTQKYKHFVGLSITRIKCTYMIHFVQFKITLFTSFSYVFSDTFFLFISSFAEMKFRFQLILFSSFIKISLLPAYNTLALISIVSSGFFGCGSCFVIIYLLMVCHISFDFNPFQTPKIAFIFHFRCQNFLLLV